LNSRFDTHSLYLHCLVPEGSHALAEDAPDVVLDAIRQLLE